MTYPYRLLFTVPALFLGACATTPLPPFPSSHPASPEAQEAPRRPFQNTLTSDEATKKSDELLAAAENGTLTPAPAEPMDMSPMPGMDMSGMKMNKPSASSPSKDSNAMPGMKMGGATPTPSLVPATDTDANSGVKMSPTPKPTPAQNSTAMPGMDM